MPGCDSTGSARSLKLQAEPNPLPPGQQLTLAPLGPGPGPAAYDGASSGVGTPPQSLPPVPAQASSGQLAGLRDSESLPRGLISLM